VSSEEHWLAQTDLLGVLPRDALDRLRGHATAVTVERGGFVCRKGDEATELYIIVSGRVAIAARASDGRDSVVAVLGGGALFGELPLFDGGVRSADARALTAAHLVAVPFEQVRAVLRERPELLWEVVRILTRRLRATDEALMDANFLDVPGRTAKRLLEIAGDDDEFAMPLTQEELAGVIGASRERVNKAIGTFTRLGWLEVSGRNRYRILDRTQLEIRASS